MTDLTTATSRREEYFTALPSRLPHSWRIMFSSATRIGSGAMRQSTRGARASAPASSIARVSATTDCMSTACSRSALRPSRE